MSAENNLRPVEAKRCTLRTKESQPLDIYKSHEGQVVVLGADLRASQAKVADLAPQGNGVRGHMITSTTERDASAAREVTGAASLQTAEATRAFILMLLRQGVEKNRCRRC